MGTIYTNFAGTTWPIYIESIAITQPHALPVANIGLFRLRRVFAIFRFYTDTNGNRSIHTSTEGSRVAQVREDATYQVRADVVRYGFLNTNLKLLASFSQQARFSYDTSNTNYSGTQIQYIVHRNTQ
jgi:hypothetical protein